MSDPVRHERVRPSWDCAAGCGPWPCTTAREAMLADGVDTSRRIAAWSFFDEAAHDLPHLEVRELFRRFVSLSPVYTTG